MTATTSLLLIVLVLAAVLFGYVKITNPHQKYSTEKYWETASVEDVYDIPEEALAPNNKNGAVLMFAAGVVTDPQVIATLVARGALINEKEELFGGTALSAAAFSNSNAKVIDELIRLGAEVDMQTKVQNKTPLLVAAEFNTHAEITERLLFHGADIEYRDSAGKSALDLATKAKNESVVEILENHND